MVQPCLAVLYESFAAQYPPPFFLTMRAGARLDRARLAAESGSGKRLAESDVSEAATFPATREEHHLSIHGGRAIAARTFRLQTKID